MVDSRGPATPNDRTELPKSDQALRRRYLFPIAAGRKQDGSTQSDMTDSPKIPTPTIPGRSISATVNKSISSEPTHNRKTPNFTIPGISASLSAASFPVPKSVHLHDWWLTKAEGKKLAVGGFASRGRQGVRVFCSAAIAKRIDTTTLETIDGMTVTISSLIDRPCTYQNGFPLKICDHFLLGFPYYWEEYVAKCYDEEPWSRFTGTSHWNDFESVSLDDLPVSRGRDLLMSAMGDSESGIVKKMILESILEVSNEKAPKVKRKKHAGTCYTANSASINVHSPRTGVATRSMTRSIRLKNNGNVMYLN